MLSHLQLGQDLVCLWEDYICDCFFVIHLSEVIVTNQNREAPAFLWCSLTFRAALFKEWGVFIDIVFTLEADPHRSLEDRAKMSLSLFTEKFLEPQSLSQPQILWAPLILHPIIECVPSILPLYFRTHLLFSIPTTTILILVTIISCLCHSRRPLLLLPWVLPLRSLLSVFQRCLKPTTCDVYFRHQDKVQTPQHGIIFTLCSFSSHFQASSMNLESCIESWS